MTKYTKLAAFFLSSAMGASIAYAETTLTIATVNNGDMIRMQRLTDDFTKANPDIKLNWVTLEENVLRQKVTTDIATKGGQFDILTIGTYEVPIWGKKGWLVPLDKLGADYDVDDLLPAIRAGLTVDGKLYAAPFYGESSFTMYRKDLMDKAGLKMPDNPTWDFISGSRQENDRSRRRERMAFACAASPAGARTWRSSTSGGQFVRRALVRREVATAVQRAGVEKDPLVLCRPDEGRRTCRARPPNGFNENLALFNSGKCGMWIDATSPALRHRQGFQGRRQGRLCNGRRTTASARTPIGSGRGPRRSRGFEQGRRGGEVHLLGD